MGVKIPATRFRLTENRLTLLVPPRPLELLQELVKGRLSAGYIGAEVFPPRKPRTTGQDSQNHLIHLYLDALVEYTGYSKDEIKYWIKVRAERRGLPMNEFPDGTKVPKSEADMDTVEAGAYIDELAQACAENGLDPFSQIIERF